MKTRIEIVGRERKEIPEIPEEALRETLINAMVHRDYFPNGVVQIDVFPNRIEISNPGKLLFDVRELGKISIARNPIIFDLVYRLGYVEKIGSGISRIRSLVPDVKFEITSNWFRVVFKRTKLEYEPEIGSEKIMRLIRENPSISAREISLIISISQRAVEKHIAKLKMEGKIRRIGPDKGGYWEVLE